MDSWLQSPPAKAPEPPPRVVLELLIAHEQELEASGRPDPALAYIRQHAAAVPLDAWGNPLPLSDGNQDTVDRLAWLLTAPLQRMEDLLKSGTLIDEDVDAVKDVFPQAYQHLVNVTTSELVQVGPPIESWAECTLAVLFQQPIETVYQGGSPDGKSQEQQQQQGKQKPSPDGATQADRRDPSVRDGG